MKVLSFLSMSFFIGLILLVVFAFNFLSLFSSLLLLSMVVLILFVFRKTVVPFRDTLKNDGEIYLSPVYGTVKSIRRDSTTLEDGSITHEVRITLSIWDEKGLYLPTSGEINYLKASRGFKISRSATDKDFYLPVSELSHTDLILKSKNQTQTLMRFIDCKMGVRPSIWLKYGDRGRGAACFGFYPFGGTLLLYLPQNSDILVFEKERVIPGQTVIAAIKDMN